MNTALTTVKEYYTHFNARNWEGMLSLVDENVRHEPNEGEPRTGKHVFAEFMAKMDASYEETLTDVVFLSDETGSRVAAEFTVNGVYKKGEPGLPEANGQRYVLPAGAFLEVRNGLITRITTYYNLSHWIELVS